MAEGERVAKLHRVQNTVFKMLNNRGYVVTDDEINMTIEQFVECYGENVKREKLFMIKSKQDDSSDQIIVFFLQPEAEKQTIGIGPIRVCIERMNAEKIFRAILVVDTRLTPAAKTATDIPKLNIEVFQDAELLYNVMEHDLVPEHQVLTDAETKALLEKYKVKESQLPRMLASDVIARHFGLKRGQVVKIIRPSETTGRYITYQYVDIFELWPLRFFS